LRPKRGQGEYFVGGKGKIRPKKPVWLKGSKEKAFQRIKKPIALPKGRKTPP